MTPERWKRTNEVFWRALEHQSDERAAYLHRSCDGDDDLRHEVESLLASFEKSDSFLETSLAEVATRLGDPSQSLVGTRLGQYEIISLLGAGGMGKVYLARDTKLGRKAALKLLPSDFTANVDRLRRFTLEARATSALNHPNILTIYNIDEVDGIHYIAAEYIEGETLRQRMDRGTLQIDETLKIAVQIAEALSAAHAHGIVHRDVKPENVMLRPDGYAKLLDFGLAKTIEQPITTTAERLPSAAVTSAGLVVGTMRYMSPEQALGRPLDTRTDTFSFGVMLCEMLTSRYPFAGESDLDVVHAIVHSPIEPPLEALMPPLHDVLEKALKKDPADRWQSMADVAAELRAIRPSEEAVVKPRASSHFKRAPQWLIIAAVASILAAGVLVLPRFRQAAGPTSREYTQLTNLADSATSPALSPDGRMLTFIRGESTFFGPGQVYVKLLPGGEPVQLTHDNLDKMSPKFMPDGAGITYTAYAGAGWDTWIVPVLGGQPRLFLANAEGLTWSDAKRGQPRLMFSEGTGHDVQMGIVTSTESRGQHRVVYMPPQTGMAHRSYLSPDGQQVLVAGEMTYYSWLPCRLVPYDGNSSHRVAGPVPSQCTEAAWSPDGSWMYFTANTGSGFHIWRQRFPDGTPEQVTSGVTEEEGIGFAPDGRSFVTSIGTRQSTIWVHDSRGERQITSEGYGLQPTISRDGRKLYYMVKASAVGSFVSGALWVVDFETGERQRLVPDFLMQHFDISADGGRVVFVAAGDTERSPVWVAALDGRSVPRRLVDKDALRAFFGAAGEVILAARENGTHFLYRVREDGSELSKIAQVFNIYSVSPDGQWVVGWVPPNALMAYPVSGGPPKAICGSCSQPGTFESNPWAPFASWSADGRFMYVQFNKSVYAIPLTAGQLLPAASVGGFQTEQEVAALNGVRVVGPRGVFPGPNPSTYAFTKVATQRNIYRVPVP